MNNRGLGEGEELKHQKIIDLKERLYSHAVEIGNYFRDTKASPTHTSIGQLKNSLADSNIKLPTEVLQVLAICKDRNSLFGVGRNQKFLKSLIRFLKDFLKCYKPQLQEDLAYWIQSEIAKYEKHIIITPIHLEDEEESTDFSISEQAVGTRTRPYKRDRDKIYNSTQDFNKRDHSESILVKKEIFDDIDTSEQTQPTKKLLTVHLGNGSSNYYYVDQETGEELLISKRDYIQLSETLDRGVSVDGLVKEIRAKNQEQ